MPYTNSVELLDTGGGPLATQVVARLWSLVDTVQSSAALDEEQTQPFALSLDESAPSQFSFTGPAPLGARHFFAMTIQDAAGVVLTASSHPSHDNRGWMFRSGAFDQTLPSGEIEVIAGQYVVTTADLPALLPTNLPPVDTTTTVTHLLAWLRGPQVGEAGGIDLEITTTTTTPAGDANYIYWGRAVLGPSAEVAAPANEAIAMDDFVESPTSFRHESGVLVQDESQLATLLYEYMVNTIVPAICRNLEATLAAKIVGATGRTLDSGGLPVGVILSLRTLNPRVDQMELRGALGAFGGVISKLPSPGSSSTSCPWTTVVSLGYAVGGLDVLHALRDGTLAATELGRWATDTYYRCAREVSAVLERDPQLAVRAAALADEIARALCVDGTLGDALRRRCEQLMRDIGAVGTSELRASVAYGLDAGVTRLV